MKKIITLLTFLLLAAGTNFANNATISNIALTGQNTTDQYKMVQFDISWENSFRDAVNWDACWVFVKYKLNGVWYHATLNTSGHTPPSGSSIDTPSDGMGVFIYRSADGTGTFSKTGVQLRWNYGTDGLADDASVTVKVIAIEMVYVPQGDFYLGDGSSEGTFRQTGSNTPVQITTSPVIVKCENTQHDDPQLEGDGILVDGDNGIDADGTTSVDNTGFPTGYKAFYCMKYEMTQEQYVDFLNMLTRAQQDTRTYTSLASGTTSVTNRFAMSNSSAMRYRNGIRCDATIHTSDPITFYCDYNGNGIGNENNDGQNIACDLLIWADGAAYADWAGMRPMTELEFEKACRGNQTPVAGEYAWGTTEIDSGVNYDYTLSNAGEANEGINANYSTSAGNCNYDALSISGLGAFRVGIFAANGSNSGRVTAGATYYGIMEMSGNIYERSVTIGNSDGRTFTGAHGNGTLATDGNANTTNWPGTNASGAGFRGGSYYHGIHNLSVSNRHYGALTYADRNEDFNGFRSVRMAP